MIKVKEKYASIEGLLPTTKSILCLLHDKKIVRLKKISVNSKYLDKVFEDFRKICKEHKDIKCYEISDQNEMILVMDGCDVSTYLV